MTLHINRAVLVQFRIGLQKCIAVLALLIMEIINQLERCLGIIRMQCSFRYWKRFLQTKYCLNNLRPISNLIYLFNLVDKVIASRLHSLQFHVHADDCQLYTTLEASDTNLTALNNEILIDYIRAWHTHKMLKLSNWNVGNQLKIASICTYGPKYDGNVLHNFLRVCSQSGSYCALQLHHIPYEP